MKRSQIFQKSLLQKKRKNIPKNDKKALKLTQKGGDDRVGYYNIAGYLQEDDQLKSLELFHYDDFKDKVYQNVATYKTGVVLSVNLFKRDDTIYIFALEGSEEFVNTHWAKSYIVLAQQNN